MYMSVQGMQNARDTHAHIITCACVSVIFLHIRTHTHIHTCTHVCIVHTGTRVHTLAHTYVHSSKNLQNER